jgi:hypothetical protein
MIQTVTTGHNNLLLNKYKHSKAILLAVKGYRESLFSMYLYITLHNIIIDILINFHKHDYLRHSQAWDNTRPKIAGEFISLKIRRVKGGNKGP